MLEQDFGKQTLKVGEREFGASKMCFILRANNSLGISWKQKKGNEVKIGKNGNANKQNEDYGFFFFFFF